MQTCPDDALDYEAACNVAALLRGVQLNYDESNFCEIWPNEYLQLEYETGVHNSFYVQYLRVYNRDVVQFFYSLDDHHKKRFYNYVSREMGKHVHFLKFKQFIEICHHAAPYLAEERYFLDCWKNNRFDQKSFYEYAPKAWAIFCTGDKNPAFLLAQLEDKYAFYFFTIIKDLAFLYCAR